MAEEAVVSKTAHVYEEVGLRKEATDRTETIRETVRKEEVEIEQISGTATSTTSGTLDPPRAEDLSQPARRDRAGQVIHSEPAYTSNLSWRC